MIIIQFAGYKGGGKTFAITSICRALARSGKNVWVIKNIHGRKMLINAREKDTWKFLKAGASMVIGIQGSLSFVLKLNKRDEDPIITLDSFLNPATPDYILVEGFYRKLKDRFRTVICCTERPELEKLVEIHKPIFICGKFAEQYKENSYLGIPVIRLKEDIDKAIMLISRV